MRDEDKTKEQLIGELEAMRQRVADLGGLGAEPARTEEALRETEERYRGIVETAPDGILTVDLKGVVTSCNSAFSTLTGYPSSEIVGKHITQLPTILPREIPQYLKLFASIIAGRSHGPAEARWRHKDGSIRWAETHAGLLRGGGRVTGLQAIVRDITERKQTEEELRQTMSDLSRFNRLAVGRELRMVELKEEVNDLLRSMGCPERYSIPTADDAVIREGE